MKDDAINYNNFSGAKDADKFCVQNCRVSYISLA